MEDWFLVMDAKDNTHNCMLNDDPSLYRDMLIPGQTLLSSNRYLDSSLHESC